MRRYYAFMETGNLMELGECSDFSEADDKAPGTGVVWIFCEDSLRDLMLQADRMLPDVPDTPERGALIRDIAEMRSAVLMEDAESCTSYE